MRRYEYHEKKLLIISVCIVIIAIIICVSLYMFNIDNKDNKIIHNIRTVGTFSGHRVDSVRVEYIGANVSTVIVKYTVDDVYICTFPDPSYDFIVYTNKNDYLYLKTAYEQGLITHDDLLAIAEAEKPYDNLYDENSMGGYTGEGYINE